MKKDELKKMTIDELKKEQIDLQREHFNLRLQLSTGQMARSHLIKEARRNVARVKTILLQKELMGSENE